MITLPRLLQSFLRSATHLRFVATWVMLAGALAPASRSSALCRDYSKTVMRIGQNLELDGQRLAVGNGHGFIAADENGFRVFDLSDPTMPTFVTSLATSASTEDVVVQGDYAYTAEGWNGLRVIDISTPWDPVLRGTWAAPTIAKGVAVDQERAFLTQNFSGVAILDVSDPEAPGLLGQAPTKHSADDLVVQGNILYVLTQVDDSWLTHLEMFDVSDPTAPVVLGTIFVGEGGTGLWYDIRVDGSTAYVSLYDFNFTVIDVADPMNPNILATRPRYGNGGGLIINGSSAYIFGPVGFRRYDVSDPAPLYAGTFPGVGASYTAGALDGDHLVTIDVSHGCCVFDVGKGELPSPVGERWGEAASVCFSDNGQFAFVGDHGFQVVGHLESSRSIHRRRGKSFFHNSSSRCRRKLSLRRERRSPRVRRIESGQPLISQCCAHARGRPGTSRSELELVTSVTPFLESSCSMHPPRSILPFLARSTPRDMRPRSLSRAIFCISPMCDAGLQIYDVANPASPVFVGSADTPGQAVDIALEADIVCIADQDAGVQLFNVADPSNPTWISNISVQDHSVGLLEGRHPLLRRTHGNARCRRRRSE